MAPCEAGRSQSCWLWLFAWLLMPAPATQGGHVANAVDLSGPGPWLVFDFSLGWGMGPPGGEQPGGVRFEIQASDGGPFRRLFRANYLRRQWYPCAVSLRQYAGKRVRFRFLVEHLEGRIMLDYPHWGNPRVVVGSPLGTPPPKEIHNFAMAPMAKAAALLPDGTEVLLTEEDPIFHKGLVTPGLLNRDLMLLVYAGDNYICVPGQRQAGIYMGVSMSVDYLRIGAGPDGQPWTGKMPPPVFAEWTVDVPAVTGTQQTAPPKARTDRAGARAATAVLHVIQHRLDTHPYQPGLVARFGRANLSMDVGMGEETDTGWAFAGFEAVGLNEIVVNVRTTGEIVGRGENSFAGLVVDYHTRHGYRKRVWHGLGAGSPDRYDLRPADWVLDGPPLTLARTSRLGSEFVDLSEAARRDQGRIELSLGRDAPSDWDGRIWFAAGVQDLPRGAGLAVRLAELGGRSGRLASAERSSAKLQLLEDRVARFVISCDNGAIRGGRDLVTGREVMVVCNDRYLVETEHDVTRATELLDRVQTVDRSTTDGRPTVVMTCRNAALPDLTITKRYALETDRVLSKRVSFSTTDPAGFFIRFEADTQLEEGFLADSGRAGALAETMTVSQGKMVTKSENVAQENFAAGDAPMAIATDYSLGLAAYRFRVNGRFVLPGKARGTARGWNNLVAVDYLKAGRTVSGENRWVMFAGDFTVFDRHYHSLPEYRALWDYRRPEWTQRILGDAMYLGPPATFPFYKACDPLLVTTTIWFLNPPWGNWGPDNDPPKSSHHDVYGIAPGWRKMFPNARVAAYTNMLFDDRSDIYRDHPDFAVTDLEEQLITAGIASDHQGRPTFYFQLLNPACREYLLNMHVNKVKAWDLDFFYMDGAGGGTEVVDWGYRDVVQSYDWLDFARELRERLQQVKPDVAWFVNGDRMPYSDIGYIEWRDEGWQALAGPNWRTSALALFRSKLNEQEGHVIVPTYGNPEADPALAAYVLMYGWCGHGTAVGRLPWMKAAFGYRGMRLVPEAVEPRWWRGDVEFEAYGFRHRNRAVVNVLDHHSAAREVVVSADTTALGLRAGEPLFADLVLMNDTVSGLKPDPNDASKRLRVWKSGQAVTRRALFAGRPCPKTLELTVPTRPVLLTTVVLSHTRENLR